MDQTSTIHNPRPNPYVGPRSFEKGQPIYGRDVETRALASLLSAERIVLLHAPSGAGKTSLIQAALIPAMEKRQFYIRPAARVNREPTKIPAAGTYNRYIFSLLSSFESARPTAEQIPEEELASLTLADYFKRRPRPEDYSFEMFIFDQFEEILTLNPADQASKIAFFSQVGRALSDDTRWVLFSMREDFLGALDPYLRYIPDGLSTRYRLDLLGKKAASQALQLPADDAGVTFEDKAVERLLNDLSMVLVQCPDGEMERTPGPYIEPVQLQVVAYRLWDSLPAEDYEIDNTDLDKLGDVGKALGAYYAQKVAEVAVLTGVSERNIREWFERKLITEGSIRSQVRKGKTASEGLPNEAVAKLEDTHIIRAEKRGEWTWYELAHDRLVQPVIEDNSIWFDKNLSLLQRQAELWNDKGRPDSLLISGKELDEANIWVKNNQASLQDHERDFHSACDKARQREQQARRIRRLMMAMGIGALILAIVAVIFANSARRARNQAQEAVIVADAASTQAVNERINAQTASTQAVEQAQLAATAQVVAQTERDKANQNAAEARISQLAAQALANQSKEYDLALLLGVEAFHRKDSYQTRSSLFDTLEYSPRLVRYETAMGSLDYTVFTNDGKYLLSIFTPDVYKMDAETYEVIGQPFHRDDNDKVYSIAVSPDDLTLAVEYEDAIVLYDMTTQEEKVEFPVTTHNDYTAIKFSPDGLFLATDDDNAAIQLWDIKTYEQFGSTMARADDLGTGSYIRDMEFSPDGTTLAVSYKDDMLFWNYRTQQPTGSTIPVEYGGIMSITYSPDGSILALGTTEDTILLWDPSTQEQITEPLTGHTDVVSSVAFSSDGKILASGSWDKAVILWNMDTFKRIGSPLLGHSGEVYQVAFSPDGSYLLSGGNDSYTILWDLRNSYSLGTVLGENSSINSVVFSPDGKTVISGGADNWLYLWNAETGEPAADPMNIAEDTAANIEVKKIAYAPDGNFLAVAIISDPVIKLWDLTAAPPKAYPLTGVSNTASVNDLAFSPDGTTLVAGDNEGRLTFWNVADQRQIDSSIQPEGQGQIQSIAFSPNGKVMAYSGDFGIVRFVDMAARTLQQNNLDYEENVGTLAYSPDGSILAVSSSDKIKLWSTSTLEAASAPMGGEQDPVESMSFSPDGKILAASYFDNMIILWDVATGQRLGEPIRGDQSKVSVNSLAFSPDGQILATGASNGQFILWYMDPAAWTDIACSIANRNLTDTEWLRYIGADEPYAKTCPNYP